PQEPPAEGDPRTSTHRSTASQFLGPRSPAATAASTTEAQLGDESAGSTAEQPSSRHQEVGSPRTEQDEANLVARNANLQAGSEQAEQLQAGAHIPTPGNESTTPSVGVLITGEGT
ncbi:unnamed protein product, partial [Amoebophrya sp. A120]